MASQQQGKAIVCHDTHDNDGWKMEQVGIREPGEGEMLVEIAASGVCHTDALIGSLPKGSAPIAFYPRVLGHEGTLIFLNRLFLTAIWHTNRRT